jgi:hypothetical protein
MTAAPTALRVVLALTSTLLAGCGGDHLGRAPEGAGTGWERLPDAPLSGRDRAAVGVIGRSVVVVGGDDLLCPPMADCSGPEHVFRDGAVLDLDTSSWRPISDAPMPVEAGERSTAAVGSTFFALTSCSPADCSSRPVLLEYDVDEDRWSQHPLPDSNPSPYAAITAVGDRVLVTPTSDERGEEPDLWFDPASGEWQKVPDDPLPKVFDRFAVPLDGGDVVLAGSPEAELEAGATTTKLVARLDAGTGRWERLGDAPGPGYQVWPAGSRLLMNGHFGSSTTWLFDPGEDRWSEVPGGLDNDRGVDLYGVVGERTATYDTPNGVGSIAAGGRARVWDARTGRYLSLPAPPRDGEVYDDSSAAVGNRLLTFGGQSWAGTDGRLLNDLWIWTPPAA